MDTRYPTIARRYMATIIDGVLVLSLLLLVSYTFQQESGMITSVRVLLVLALFLIYEPICTSKFCTVGQKLMGVRVRKLSDNSRISILAAYLRIIVKVALGLVSFLTIPFTKCKRGIHDFAVRSVVVYADQDNN